MPADFRLFDKKAEIFLPHATTAEDNQPGKRGFSTLELAGRLNDGVTLEQARDDVKTIAATLAQDYARLNDGWTLRLIPLSEVMSGDTRGTLPLVGW